LDWVEYIIRYEWVDGGGIWAQVMNREQNKSAIVYLPLDTFEHEGQGYQNIFSIIKYATFVISVLKNFLKKRHKFWAKTGRATTISGPSLYTTPLYV